jgi:Cu(I)/Ag(I) efflux system protein CusF
MKRLISFLALALLALSSFAQTAMTAGEVTKIDKAQAKVTLKHGEIKNLDMPPMTMVFRAKDPKMLDGLAIGDKIRFSAEKIDGAFTITAVSKGP